MKKSDFYDAVWERLVALKSYRLISTRNKTFRLTKRGIEFLKHDDKEYYLGKILLMDKYKRTKHPHIFIECFNQFVKLTKQERESIRRRIFAERIVDNYDYNTWEKLVEKDAKIWYDFIKKISHNLKRKKSQNLISRVCDTSLRNIVVGTKAPIDIPIQTLKKILKELKETESSFVSEKSSKIEEKSSFIVKSLLELHLEEIIRRNFKTLFPDLQIIDNNQHYYTNDGNYIDILCKHKKDNAYVIIELKRDRSPSRALVQLLDYMNQIMEEFNTKNVKGTLVCKKLDKRTKSALKTIRNKLKNPDDISIVEFDLKMGLHKI